jgi:hypothetical protein
VAVGGDVVHPAAISKIAPIGHRMLTPP